MNILGEEQSFNVMKQLRDLDIRKLLTAMSQTKKAPIHLINRVLTEFLFKLAEKEEIIFDEDLTKPEIVSKGLGKERTKQLFGTVRTMSILEKQPAIGLDNVEVETLAEFLMEEHPQTIALVMANLEVDKQAKMLRVFPESLRVEVALRMSTLDNITSERVEELAEVLRHELTGSEKVKRQSGGIIAVAELINALDRKTMTSLISEIETREPEIAEEIRQKMFTFNDLVRIDDRAMQLILREVSSEKLLKAMKTCSDDLREKIFRCMSKRAAEMLREDLGAMGPVRVSEVETAQREIINLAVKLQKEGKIILGVGEDAELI